MSPLFWSLSDLAVAWTAFSLVHALLTNMVTRQAEATVNKNDDVLAAGAIAMLGVGSLLGATRYAVLGWRDGASRATRWLVGAHVRTTDLFLILGMPWLLIFWFVEPDRRAYVRSKWLGGIALTATACLVLQRPGRRDLLAVRLATCFCYVGIVADGLITNTWTALRFVPGLALYLAGVPAATRRRITLFNLLVALGTAQWRRAFLTAATAAATSAKAAAAHYPAAWATLAGAWSLTAFAAASAPA